MGVREGVRGRPASGKTPEAASYRRWFIFSVLALQFILVYFHRVSSAVVAPELTGAFHISGTALGILSAGYFYTYAFMQLPVGLLADSWGPRKTVASFTLLAGFGAILFGLSPGFTTATFARILVGLGVSTVFVSSMKIFVSWFHGEEYARVSGMFLSLGGIGWLLASAPLAIMSRWFGWRMVFVAIGAVTLLLSVTTWSIIKDRPKGLPPDGNPEAPKKSGSMAKNVGRVLGERYFWPLALWSFCNGGIAFGFFGLWAGPYLVEAHGISKAATGNILAMVALAMIAGSPFIGYLTDKVVRSRKAILLASAALHSLCWAVMLACSGSVSRPSLYVLFFLMGLTSVAIPVVLLTATKELFPGEIAGTGQGIMNLFPFAGSMVFQPAIGLILDRTRGADGGYVFENAFRFLLLVSLAAIVSLLFMKGAKRSRQPAVDPGSAAWAAVRHLWRKE